MPTRTVVTAFVLLIAFAICANTSRSDSIRRETVQADVTSFQQLVEGLKNQQVLFSGRDNKAVQGTLSMGANDYLVITYVTKVTDSVPYSSILMVRTQPGRLATI